ncbi:MAG: hypothetical protein ACYTBW_07395 [Planctomycetota bacterium]
MKISRLSVDYSMGMDDTKIQTLINEKKIVFDELVAEGAIIIDGVAEFIQRLIDSGICRAICSGALRSDIDLSDAGRD